jgi:hypothetical protein
LCGPVDLAFIDGMHKAEFALRDFLNLEKNGHAGTVILLDDVLPDKIEWATRERTTPAWTGDVYKVIAILRQYRPDLEITVLDVDSKGLACVTGLDPTSTMLEERYHAIETAILSGAFDLRSVESIRALAGPVSADAVGGLLRDRNAPRR